MEVLLYQMENGTKWRSAKHYLYCLLSAKASHLVLPSVNNPDNWEYECVICDDFLGYSYKDLEYHLKEHELYECGICPELFNWQGDAIRCRESHYSRLSATLYYCSGIDDSRISEQEAKQPDGSVSIDNHTRLTNNIPKIEISCLKTEPVTH